MKMPTEGISSEMFAPCGMNCMVCYKHCYHKKPCAGCIPGDEGKPKHCRKCKIKDCVREKELSYCYECPEYPCRQLRSLERSYNTRYHASLVENSRMVQAQGGEAFMEKQKEKFTCSKCGGIISIHDAECSECQEKMQPYAFTLFAKRYGEEMLLDCLERNERNGVIYHRQGITGDYDDFEDIEMLMEFIKTGRR